MLEHEQQEYKRITKMLNDAMDIDNLPMIERCEGILREMAANTKRGG